MPERKQKVVVIGGGAAGFFGAVTCAAHHPAAEVIVLEKTNKLLAKVRVSGGGRCNVTHNCQSISMLLKNYPRGAKHLRQPFERFGVADTIRWFESRGVKLKTEPDGRMFPLSDSSETIIGCLLAEARKTGVQIRTSTGVNQIGRNPVAGSSPLFTLLLSDGSTLSADRILIATGGSPKPDAYTWLQQLGHTIVPPVPSLFTFNVPGSAFTDLQGVSVPFARVKIAGRKLEESGPLLVTHWGFSGPAVLRTSAWGARELNELGYRFEAQINWVPELPENELRQHLAAYREANPRRVVIANPMFQLPARLWKKLCEISGIGAETKWADLPRKNQNKLLEELLRSAQKVAGKTTFKEEFVTAGGISLAQVNMATMQSKVVPGLFFAGEVIDVDGITGGFNFQAAWATGYVAGLNLGR